MLVKIIEKMCNTFSPILKPLTVFIHPSFTYYGISVIDFTKIDSALFPLPGSLTPP